ncbi:PREDICTED: uncharacterized protein LOC109216685 [Nicotiana attenuata]|uniref:Uncharacterized protein n=1 Tax=Nicotiana attenuata TaxID=49451 RepID=A0A1J6KE69_NICAT|nr:PREDICTED: uncharacterized protein LOC109216685 [Nicotiana attenuata]OIT23232.1 hypothetical protein A4A49_30077 [Nicotiana attenuata]
MEESAKDQSSVSANARRSASKLLRYPLRSASKSKEEKPPLTDSSNSSANSARGRPASSISKSAASLHLSGKEKSAKPPRRLSVPSKPIASPVSRPLGTITPISETRAKRSTSNQGKSDTPLSIASKSSIRRKYDLISSASYWLSQIKLSESAAKHSISLGFFRLALEAGSEPFQRLRDELKSYVQRHSLVELEEPVKQLFDSYNILQDSQQLQVSETCSHAPKEETCSSNDDIHSSSSVANTQRKLSRVLNKDSTKTELVKEPIKEKTSKIGSTPRTRNSVNKIAATAKSTQKAGSRTTKEKLQKLVKPEPNKDQVKRQGRRSAQGEGPDNACTSEKVLEEDKENLDTPQTEVIST